MRPAVTAVADAAAVLVPTLRERRIETDGLRRLPDATVAELRELGVLGLAVPPERGGLGLGVDAIFEASRVLGSGCGATAWTAGNWAIHGLLLAMFPEAAQREVFAEGARLPIMSTGFSPARGRTIATEGGALLDGQWDFSSGVDHADWVVVVAVGEQGPLAHLVPRSELEVIDVWHTAGLRGTGSNDVRAEALFVPEHRLLPMADAIDGTHVGRELYDDPYLRLPLTTVFGVGIMGTIMGLAAGALETFVGQTTEKVGGLSGIAGKARPEVHHRIGESAAEIHAATTVVRGDYAEMRRLIEAGGEATLRHRIGWRRNMGWAAKTAVIAVNRLYDVGGAHSLSIDDQLLQFWRDINAASHHYGVQSDIGFSGFGRASLGQDPDVPML